MSAHDWRKDYVICEHLAADETLSLRTDGSRACCEDCYRQQDAVGLPMFLHLEVLDFVEVQHESRYTVARVPTSVLIAAANTALNDAVLRAIEAAVQARSGE